MAHLGATFDATTIDPATGFELFPVGKYVVQIVDGERFKCNKQESKHLLHNREVTKVRTLKDEVVHVVYLSGLIRGDQKIVYAFRSAQAGLTCEHPTCGACPDEQPISFLD